MMKINNGGYVLQANTIALPDKNDRYSYVLLIFEGVIVFGGSEYGSGNSIFLSKDQTIEPVVKCPINYAWFVLEDADELGVSSAIAFEIAELEKARAFVDLVCPDGRWKEINDKFSEGSALMLTALCGIDKAEFGPTGNKCVDMVKRYIDHNYASDIKVEEIAEKFDIDRKYLRNLFFRYLGVSTKDYLMNIRIEKAKELLTSGELSVGEVALAVGYSDALGFSKIFKKHVGVSPSEFRSGEPLQAGEIIEEIKPTKKEDIKYFLL